MKLYRIIVATGLIFMLRGIEVTAAEMTITGFILLMMGSAIKCWKVNYKRKQA